MSCNSHTWQCYKCCVVQPLQKCWGHQMKIIGYSPVFSMCSHILKTKTWKLKSPKPHCHQSLYPWFSSGTDLTPAHRLDPSGMSTPTQVQSNTFFHGIIKIKCSQSTGELSFLLSAIKNTHLLLPFPVHFKSPFPSASWARAHIHTQTGKSNSPWQQRLTLTQCCCASWQITPSTYMHSWITHLIKFPFPDGHK